MNDNYPTSDTPLAAYLYLEGFKITDIDYSDPRAEFLFIDSTELQDAIRLFSIGKGKVDAKNYARIQRKLMTIVKRQIPWIEGVMNG